MCEVHELGLIKNIFKGEKGEHFYLVQLKQVINLNNKKEMGKFSNFSDENTSRNADEMSLWQAKSIVYKNEPTSSLMWREIRERIRQLGDQGIMSKT